MRNAHTVPDTVDAGTIITGDTGEEGHLLQLQPGGITSFALSPPNDFGPPFGPPREMPDPRLLVRQNQTSRGVYRVGRP